MEFRLTVTVARHGRDLDNGERFLEGFIATHPETGPVVDQNLETGELSITFSFEAEDFREAAERGGAIFNDGANSSGLEPTDFISAQVSVVEPDRELQPA
jgi:hypothetical protein